MQDSDVTVAQIREKVGGLERGYTELRADLHSVENEMRRGFTAVDQKIAAGFQTVASKLDERTSPPWQAYGVLATVLIAIGGALFWPIRESETKHDLMLEQIRTQVVPRVEHERLWREQSDRDRVQWEEIVKNARELSNLQGQLHPIIPR